MAPLMSKVGLAVCCIALIQIGEIDFSTALVEDDSVSNGDFLDKGGASTHVGENGNEDSLSAPAPQEGSEGDPLEDGLAFDSGTPAGDDDADEGEQDEALGAVDNVVRRLMGLESLQARNQFRQHDDLDSADRRLSSTDDFEEGAQEDVGMSGERGGEDDEDLGLDRLFEVPDKAGPERSAQREEDTLLEFLSRFLSQLGAKDVPEEALKQVVQSALTLFKAMSNKSGTEGAGKDVEGGVEGRRLSSRTGRQSEKDVNPKTGISERAHSSDDRMEDAAAAGSTDIEKGGPDEANVRVKAAARDLVRSLQALMGGLGDVVLEGGAGSAAVDLTEKLMLGGKALKQKTQDTTADVTQRLKSLLEEALDTLAQANPELLQLALEANKEMVKEIKNAVGEEELLG